MDNFIDWSVFHYGGYARHELLLLADLAGALRSSAHRQLAFFDIGANVGNHSLFMAHKAPGFSHSSPSRRFEQS